MNKQRKTSHILNVFQYDHTTGAVTLPAGLSLPTPDSTDNSTKVATTAWIRAYVGSLSYATASSVETAIADLVASAPTTLNTLNELATALGNDPNFATTITTSIGTKVPQSRTITINGTAYDLSADRAWTIASGVTSFNTRTGAITLTSGDVTGALGFTPYNATNPSGYITGITSAMVTGALGYTPYNSSNPSGYITGITSGMVTGALGYTPYNSSNPSGYITSSALTSYALPLSGGTMTGSIVNNTDGAVILESNASENNNWLWKENAKQWGLFWFNRGSQSGQTIGSYTTIGAELMFMGGSSGIAMPSGWTGYIAGSNIAAMISNYNGYIYSASTVYAAGDMRAPIFYDINDTGYYGNFASTSRVNGIYADYIGIGQDINTSYRLITNGSIYLNSNGNGWAEGVFKQRRSGSTFYDVIDSGNIGSQSVNYASNAGLLNALSSYVWNNSSAASTYHQGISASFVRSEVDGFPSYGSVMTVRTYSGAMGSLQLYTPYSPTYGGYRLGYRSSNYDTGAWDGWKYLLNTVNDPYAYNMNQYVRTTDDVTHQNLYVNSWFRNNAVNAGLYNQAVDTHFYSSSTGEWNFATSNGSWTQINLRPGGHGSVTRGAFYADTGNNVGILNNTGSWGIRLDSNRHSYMYGNLTVGLTTGASSIYMSDSDEGTREIHCNSNRIGFLTQAGSWGSWCDDSGNWYAPVFYDSNNGGYYLDPDSTSNLLNIQMPYRGNGTPNILVNNGGSENWGAIHIGGGSGNLRIGKSDAGRSWSGRVSLAMHVGASESFRVHSDGWDSLFEVWGSSGYARLKGSLEVGSDVYLGTRGTWLSSWLNQNVTTGASPSFSEVTAGYHRSYYLTGRYDVSVDHTYGIYFQNYVDYSYAIFRESGGWSHPYPDLRIAFHTGIKIGAYYGYNGTRFYNNSDMATITASVNDGDNNFRGYYDIIAYASDRRLKHKVQPIENALDKVNSLTGMTYQWNEVGSQHGWEPDTEVREAGVFAQDVQAVLPEAVKLAPFDQGHDKDGKNYSKSGQNFLTVKYEKIVPLLIEAIKEQQVQVETQQSEIAELKDLVKQLLAK